MDTKKDQFLADLVAQHGTSLEKYLARKLNSSEDAAEVAQDAFFFRADAQNRGARLGVLRVHVELDADTVQLLERMTEHEEFRFRIQRGALEVGAEPAICPVWPAPPRNIDEPPPPHDDKVIESAARATTSRFC